MSSDNPFIAGLPVRSDFTCPSAVTAYTLCKVSANMTLAVVATTDGNEDVAGVFLASRSTGDNAGVPVCVAKGYPVPMLSDGAGALAAGDRVAISTVTAGRVAIASSGLGIGTVLQGTGAVADSVVLVQFDGAGDASAGLILPLTTDLYFANGAARNIYVQDAAGSDNGQDLEIRAGKSATGALIGGTMTIRSGDGADRSGVTAAADGGDLIIKGGDAGANGGDATLGGHGGNLHLIGGEGTILDPPGTADAYQHGGIIIGETQTDELRIGHEPVAGINSGHIRHTGHFARGGASGELDYNIRFESGTSALVDVAQPTTDGTAGTTLTIKSGRGGNAVAAPGGAGSTLALVGATGGDGAAAQVAGAGGSVSITGGAGGANNGGGGGDGGSVSIDGGDATGAGNDGVVSIGTAATTRSTTIGRAAAATTIAGLVSFDMLPNVDQTIKVADEDDANTRGRHLTVKSGKGNGTGDGGDLRLIGADRGASGTYGGSVIIDGGNGNSAANDGVILLGTNNAGPAGGTASMTFGTEGNALTLNSLPQSASVPTIASAATIAPVTLVCKVSGVAAIDTITLPYASFKGTVVIIPTGVFTWAATGNIALAGTAVVSKALHMTCDGTNWYPSYV